MSCFRHQTKVPQSVPWMPVGLTVLPRHARQRPYPSDLSNARWDFIESTLAAWRTERRGKSLDIGHPPQHYLRRIMDIIPYVDRTGIPWRYLPHDFAPWETIYGHFAAWQKDVILVQLNGLQCQLVRNAEGWDTEPSACVLDAQSVVNFFAPAVGVRATPPRHGRDGRADAHVVFHTGWQRRTPRRGPPGAPTRGRGLYGGTGRRDAALRLRWQRRWGTGEVG